MHWRLHNQNARVSIWQHFHGIRGKGVPTDSRHCNGHQLCPSPSRHISVLIRSGIHSLSDGKKQLASQFNFTNPDFQNNLGQLYPAELEIKDTTVSNTSASYFDLLLSIRGEGEVSCALPFMTNVTITTSIIITKFPFLSSNIPSSPAYVVFISQLTRYARACSSMNVLFWERCDFHISILSRDMSGNVWHCPAGSSIVDMGI